VLPQLYFVSITSLFSLGCRSACAGYRCGGRRPRPYASFACRCHHDADYVGVVLWLFGVSDRVSNRSPHQSPRGQGADCCLVCGGVASFCLQGCCSENFPNAGILCSSANLFLSRITLNARVRAADRKKSTIREHPMCARPTDNFSCPNNASSLRIPFTIRTAATVRRGPPLICRVAYVGRR